VLDDTANTPASLVPIPDFLAAAPYRAKTGGQECPVCSSAIRKGSRVARLPRPLSSCIPTPTDFCANGSHYGLLAGYLLHGGGSTMRRITHAKCFARGVRLLALAESGGPYARYLGETSESEATTAPTAVETGEKVTA